MAVIGSSICGSMVRQLQVAAYVGAWYGSYR